MLKILDHKGNVINGVDISALHNIGMLMYEKMMYIRMADQKAINLQRTGVIGTYPSTMGQEAIDSVAGFLMTKDDVFVPYYRDQGILLQRGYDFSDILRYWGGSELASSNSNNTDFPICVPIATQYTHAAGAAASLKMQGKNGMVLVTGGEGSTSKGDFYESINVASLWNLPVVFLVKNNQWAISTPSTKQTKVKSFADKALAVGMDSVQVDGNDVFAMAKILNDAFNNARSGKGPMLIEAVTYRLSDHTTADDATRYRSNDQLKKAWEHEPIKRLRTFLFDKELLDEEKEKLLIDHLKAKIQQEVEKYESTVTENPEDMMFDYMYEDNSHLASQKREATDE